MRILCFHRVVRETQPMDWPWASRGTLLTESQFRASLSATRETHRFVDENEATEILSGDVRDNDARPACWITFDDGYRNNLTVAAPILEELGIRPTLFLTTDTLVPGFRLPVDRWYAVLVSARRRKAALPGGHLIDLDHHDDRARLVNGPEKRAYVTALAEEQDHLVASLAEALEGDPISSAPQYLSTDDLARLEQYGWRIGPHGARHQLLTQLSPEAGAAEVIASHEHVHSLCRSPSRWFAYPDGAVDVAARELARAVLSPHGYAGALTVERRDASSGEDPWMMPRCIVSPRRVAT